MVYNLNINIFYLRYKSYLPIFILFLILTYCSDVIFFCLISFLVAIVFVKTTELVVTSKRVIAKFRLLKKETIELNPSRVESLHVSQIFLKVIEEEK